MVCPENVEPVSYQDHLDWEACELVDWEAACRQLVLDAMDGLKKSEVLEPAKLVKACLLTEVEKASFRDWLQPFQAGMLFQRAQKWREIFAQGQVKLPIRLSNWLEKGYSAFIDFSLQNPQPRPLQLSKEEAEFAQTAVDNWIKMGAIEIFDVRNKHPKAVICNCVVAYRGETMDRICWSGVPVNEGLDDQKFKMETVRDICGLGQPGDWAFTFDLEKGFQQVPLKPSFSDFCLFQLNGRVYRWLVLPQGLKSAPRDFSYIVRAVLAIFRQQGIRCAFYIDDLIFLARSKAEALALREKVMGIFYTLGFRISLKKSLLSPGQLVKHLGFIFDLANCRLWVPEAKITRIIEQARAMLGALGQINGYKLAKFLGVLRSNTVVMTCALIFSSGLAKCLQQLPLRPVSKLSRKQLAKWNSMKSEVPSFALRDFKGKIQLTPWAIAELRFWSKCSWQLRSSVFNRPVDTIFITDACPEGYGVVRCAPTALGCPRDPVFQVDQLLHGAWWGKCNAHSTSFEFRTTLHVISQQAEQLRGQRVHAVTDNVGAAFILGKGCLKNLRLHFWAAQLAWTCLKYDIQLSSQYLCGNGVIAAGADSLSRGADPQACRLSKDVFQKLWKQFGPFHVDAWACAQTRQAHPNGKVLPCVSPFAISQRLGVDAMSFCRPEMRLYAFPPSVMLDQYVPFVCRQKQPVVLVVPEWPTRAWWALLAHFGGERMYLGTVHDVIVQEGAVSHPFGANFETEQALDTKMWAVAVHWPDPV